MKISVIVAESDGEEMTSRDKYKWFPLGTSNKRLQDEYR
jgi:hypothetical protein